VQILRIRMHNYRQYPDLDLTMEGDERDVLLLVARIGAGKTNLLNAATWCLYGKELMFDSSDTGLTMRSVRPVDDAASSVELRIKFQDGREALVLRELVDPMTLAPVHSGVGRLTVQESRSEAEGFEPVASADDWVKRYLPQRIQPYFLINAERVIQFSSDTGALPVQKAVLQIAQIDTLERLVRHLETVRGDYIQKLRTQKVDAATEQLSTQIGTLDQQITTLRADVDRHKDEIELLDANLAQNDDDLDRLRQGSEAISRFRSVEQRYSDLSVQYEGVDRSLNAQYAQVAPFMFAKDALTALAGSITRALDQNILPPPVSLDYLESLLASNECLCGCSLAPGSPHRTTLEELVERMAGSSARGLRLNELRVPLSLLERGRDSALSGLDHLKQEARDLLGELESVGRELEKARDEVEGLKEEDIRSLLAARRKAEERRREEQRLHDQKSYQLGEAQKARDNLQAELKRKLSRQETAKEFATAIEFASQCLEVAEQAYSEIALETRQAVSAKLRELFFEMHWASEKYRDVSIDEGYTIHVLDESGQEALAALSDGEKVILAIAFSQALSEVSGFELPMVFDSPFVKLDKDTKILVAESLAKHVTNRQLMLLMKPGEYDQTIEAAFTSRTLKEWMLVPDSETRSTSAVRKD